MSSWFVYISAHETEVTTGSIPRVQRSRYIFVARVLDSDTVAYEQNQFKLKVGTSMVFFMSFYFMLVK